jgi:AcrR family transcriptional regulator
VRGATVNKDNLQARKQQVVRNAIYNAAIELFAAKGFDETTVEEVAKAAGVSRRSFFRYFASKDDLLAQNVVHYGDVLTAAITACPPAFTPLETVRETVLSVIKHTVATPVTRQVIEISQRSASARQAHLSRMMNVEDSVAAAFAARLRSASGDHLKPRLLATLTLSIINVAIISWYRGEYQDLSTAAKQAFSHLARIVCDQSSSTQSKEDVVTGRKLPGPVGRRKSGATKR